MILRERRWICAAAWGAIVWFASARPARAQDTRSECLENHEQAQRLKLKKDYVGAKKALRLCSQALCPALILQDCTAWTEEIERVAPSLMFAVRSERGDESEVKVFIDGEQVLSSLDGSALQLNPGLKKVRFELDGYPAQERTILLREGERERVVSVEFKRATAVTPAPTPAPSTTTPPAPAPPPRPPSESTPPYAGYAFGGAAIVLAGVGAGYGLSALSARDDAKERCSPLCSDADLKSTHDRALIADVLFGVAGAAAVVSIYLIVSNGDSPRERARVGISSELAAGRATWSVRGAF